MVLSACINLPVSSLRDGVRDPPGRADAHHDRRHTQHDQQHATALVLLLNVDGGGVQQRFLLLGEGFERGQVADAALGHVAFIDLAAGVQVAGILGGEHRLAELGVGFARVQHLLEQGLEFIVVDGGTDLVLDLRGAAGRFGHQPFELFLVGRIADHPCAGGARRVDLDDLAPLRGQALIADFHVDHFIGHRAGTAETQDADHRHRRQQQQDEGEAETQTRTDLQIIHGEPLA
jgi:hypothetical protein